MESSYPSPIPDDATIACLEQYSFSDEAAHVIIKAIGERKIQYEANIRNVWEQVRHGMYGLIPYENTSDGVVWPHLYQLLKEDVAIVGAVQLKVRMCAGSVLPNGLLTAETVCSHPKGLGQTREFIDSLPGVKERKEFSSTAAAARYVREQNDPRNLAFASRLALKANDLIVVSEDIADCKGDENATQFFLVRKNGYRKLPDYYAPYHAWLLNPHNQIGTLLTVASIVSNARMDFTSIQSHSRPMIDGKKQYHFFAELDCRGTTPEEVEIGTRQMAKHPIMKEARCLGSYYHIWTNE